MVWMKCSRSFIWIIVLCGICCFAQTSPDAANQKSALSDPGFTLTVTLPANPIHLGSPINITVTVKNISNSEIYWSSDRPDTAYRAFGILLTKNGQEVETTFFHRKITARNRPGDPNEVEHGSSLLAPFPPGEKFVMTIDLKRLYEITEAGEYTLDVRRMANDNKTVVHSNAVTLKIVP
jgi:hypothetical protein